MVIAVTMVACTILEVIVTLAILVYYHHFQITSFSAVWGLAIVSSIATSVLVIITALQMLEAKRLRIESVKPSLSLEPAGFVASGGFTMRAPLITPLAERIAGYNAIAQGIS